MTEREFNYEINFKPLPANGVRHLEIKIPEAKNSVSIAFIKTGSVNETPGIKGINHLVEHVNYHGSKDYPDYHTWTRAVDSIGAEHDAESNKEFTEYHVFGPSENNQKLIFLSSQPLKPKLPGRKIASEKEYVLKEKKEYFDDTDELTKDLFEHLLFKETPMADSGLGSEEEIRSLNRRDLRKWVEKWYCGANILIVTAGKVDRTRKFVEEYFGSLPEGEMLPYEGKGEYGTDKFEVVTSEKTENAQFFLGVPSVSRDDDRYYVMKVIASILGGSSSGGSSRLYQTVQIKNGQTYNLFTTLEARSDTGYLAARGSVDPTLIESILGKIRKEMFSLSYSVTKEEVKRAKSFLKGQLKRDFENTFYVAKEMGIPALMFDKVESPKEVLRRIDAVKLDHVRRVADEILKPEEERLVVLGPVNEKLKKIRRSNFR